MKGFSCWVLILIGSFFNAYVLNAQSFESESDRYISQLRIPSAAIAVVKGDSLIFFKGYGEIDPETHRGIVPDAIFGIASLTKTFTALALQQAVNEGKIQWEDKIKDFPNQYFNTNRWNERTTIAHCISHTSESNPIGGKFVYNGSKFNLVFNVFETLNSADNSQDITRRFNTEIENRILLPLHMDHTLVRYDSLQSDSLKNNIVIPYNFEEDKGTFKIQDINMKSMQSGPAFGMMSSVKDLIHYSNALDQNLLLSKIDFEKITKPFYQGSPYGLGWFYYRFEGIEMNWVYGYGNNDAAIMIKIPELNLTFIFLAATNVPSATTRLGYGNPLNSVLANLFLEYFVFGSENKNLKKEKKYANASLGILAPNYFGFDKNKAEMELNSYLKSPSPYFNIENPSVFELLSLCDSKKRAQKWIRKYDESGYFHPSSAYFIGRIYENNGDMEKAIKYYVSVADDDFYKENSEKFFAMLWLAKHYYRLDPNVARSYLKRLIDYKENISSLDVTYQEAMKLFNEL